MMISISILFYLSVLVFLILIVHKAYKISKAPIHLRWELYPLPGEGKRSSYGGSKLEDYEWWTRKHKKSLFAEFKAMFSEIVFLKAVREHNPKLWFGSFPFHFALYLYTFFFCAVLLLVAFKLSYGSDIRFIVVILKAVAFLCGILGTAGSLILLLKRSFNKNLSMYSTSSHYFNIFIIGLLFLTFLVWTVNSQNIIISYSVALSSILTFSTAAVSFTGILHFLIVILLLSYIPFTHMTHFFTKYFTYHKVRWDDKNYNSDSKQGKKLSEYLKMPVTWSAPHIAPDGETTWIAVASGSKKEDSK